MSDERYTKVYRSKGPDFGHRLTGLMQLNPYISLDEIYQGLYYDGSGYDGFPARYVYIAKKSLESDWEEDISD